MLLSMQIPQWLVDFWAVYNEAIVPVLVTILVSLLTYVAIKIRSDAKLAAAKTEIQIKAMQDMANKETGKTEIEEYNKGLAAVEKKLGYIVDIFNLAFQNSNLSPEIKNNITNVVNKMKFGSTEDLAASQQEEIERLKEQLVALTEKTAKQTEVIIKNETNKRIRR